MRRPEIYITLKLIRTAISGQVETLDNASGGASDMADSSEGISTGDGSTVVPAGITGNGATSGSEGKASDGLSGNENGANNGLTAEVWQEVIAFAREQGVLGICLDGVAMLPSEQKPPRDILMGWIAQVAVMENQYKAHKAAIDSLRDFYGRHGIRMLVLKGYSLSLNWPVPQHRPVGDLDIYLYGEQPSADHLISTELGIKIHRNHEHHTVFRYQGTMVENHYDFINVRAHKDSPAIEARLKSLAENPVQLNAEFLPRHMGQHFAAERITLRILLDWALFVKANSTRIDWQVINRFLQQINAICVDYLGIPEEHFPTLQREPALEERIFADILCPEFSESTPTSGPERARSNGLSGSASSVGGKGSSSSSGSVGGNGSSGSNTHTASGSGLSGGNVPSGTNGPIGGTLRVVQFKYRRWMANRWKHTLVYNEKLLPMFIRLAWSHLPKWPGRR